jgi:uncharacterized protein involved in exopolysaccharide biosynthesis
MHQDAAQIGPEAEQPRFGFTPPQPGESDGFDINEIIRVLYRRIRLVAAVAVGFFVAGLLFNLLLTPQYTATSLVLISPAKEHVTSKDEDVLQTSAPDAATIDSELEVVHSRNLLGELADELAKTPSPPPPATGLRRIVGAIAAPFTREAETGTGTSAQPGGMNPAQREAAINKLTSAITAKRRRLSYVIEITAADPSPARAALITNKLAELYMQSQYEARFDAARRANQWLSTRLTGLKAELETKELPN